MGAVSRKQRSFFAGVPWYQQPALRCQGGRRTGSAGPPDSTPVGRRLPWPERSPAAGRRPAPDGAHRPKRDALCLGSLASSGSDRVLPMQGVRVRVREPPLGKIPQATWQGQKKFKKKKKERKRNACCLHNPSPSMHQPAPSPRNTVGAVGADQEWSFPRDLHPVKLPLTVPQKSGAVEQRGCGCKS